MATVKGSKQIKMVVVPHRPWLQWAVGGGVAVALLLVAIVAYAVGKQLAYTSSGDARAERDALRAQVGQLEADNGRLQQQLLNLEQTGKVDKDALGHVQETIVALREQISDLEEELLFYKQIVGPSERPQDQPGQEQGLVIGTFDLQAGAEPGVLRYKIELRQQGNNDDYVTGHVNVNVVGQQGGQELSLPLHTLSSDVDGADIRLRFRYFQNVEGQLTLPADFVPQRLQVVAVAQGNNAKTVQQSFDWQNLD